MKPLKVSAEALADAIQRPNTATATNFFTECLPKHFEMSNCSKSQETNLSHKSKDRPGGRSLLVEMKSDYSLSSFSDCFHLRRSPRVVEPELLDELLLEEPPLPLLPPLFDSL